MPAVTDPTGRGEGRLIRAGQPYLRLVRGDRHSRIYEVLGTPGLSDGVGAVTRIAPQSFALLVARGPDREDRPRRSTPVTGPG